MRTVVISAVATSVRAVGDDDVEGSGDERHRGSISQGVSPGKGHEEIPSLGQVSFQVMATTGGRFGPWLQPPFQQGLGGPCHLQKGYPNEPDN